MNYLELAYCNECEDLVRYDIEEEVITEKFKGQIIKYKFKVGKCKECGCEVATGIGYNSRKSKAKLEAYKTRQELITLKLITEILRKYDISKEGLADIAGFGKVTIKRYYDGIIPSREYSDILFNILNKEQYFMELVEKNKEKLKNIAYKKILVRYNKLMEIENSKILQISNYIVTHMDEVNPLVLEKLLWFSNGINYALNGTWLIGEVAQAWPQGPVYIKIYNRYKSFGYKPIDDGIYSTHGCVISQLKSEEIKAINMAIKTFGLYSSVILEKISCSQSPWKEKRIGYEMNEPGNESIDENSIKKFFEEHELNKEEVILRYIMDNIKC